jgi:NADPH-dependent 2,4-dienoyl-CoA reductase/sulfur reductase-like enzyme/nitrite reductase/ring-hydroxylating ferredoxin subunit
MGGEAIELSGPDLTAGVAFDTLIPGKPLLGRAGGEAVVVVRLGDEAHAIGASCTHYGGPLAEGLVVGDTIRCPWHHACFDLRTGAAVRAPALSDNACFEVVRAGALVQVRGRKESTKAKRAAGPSSVVIIGAGAAGTACVEMLRKEGYEGPITMIGAEDPGPVDRPNLSKDYLAGNAPEEWIPLGTKEHFAEMRVDLVPNTRVTGIDTKGKQVTLVDGRVVEYGALLLATGAEPSVLPIEGAKLPHVATLRTLADSRGIIERAKTAKRAVVIGASFIGLEVAASLIARGLEVPVVAPDQIPLARILGDELGAHVKRVHESKGVKFHLGTKPSVIRAAGVELANGEKLAADLVVMGVGVKPRVALAEAAGLKVDNGVVVDDQLRTSVADVWAAGDIARYPDPRVSEPLRIEHWVVAERQGQHVARAMLGRATKYRDVPFFWSNHYDVVQIRYAGSAPDFDEVVVYGTIAKNDAAIAYRRKGKTLAVATLGRDLASLQIEEALEKDDFSKVDALLGKKSHFTA